MVAMRQKRGISELLLLQRKLVAITAPLITATSPARTTSTTTSILTRFRLIDRKPPSTMLVVVQGINRSLGIGVVGHFNESKPTAPA